MNKQTMIPTVIGIDIGAHSTKIAAVQRGAIQILTNQANFRQTPSIVGYGQGQRKIGQSGNVKLKSNFKNTIVSPMRYLALSNPSEQLNYNPSLTQFSEQTGLHFRVKNSINKQLLLSPEQVLASYLTQLNRTIVQNNLDAKLITIAVPSYFTETQKRAVLNAAEISQMNSGKIINLVEENIAIGLDYGVFKKAEAQDNKVAKIVCFVDFGHSKLSVTIIKFIGDKMEVLLEKHCRNLGCRDIDQKLFKHYSQLFNKKTGLDLKQNKKACLKLLETIHRQRKILTGISQTDISIECLMEDEDINQTISRSLMVQIASEVFQEIKNTLVEFKQNAQKLGISVGDIQLVGGGTRIPSVISIINETFGKQPSRTINSSESIAKGATLASVQKSGLFRLHTLKVVRKAYNPIRASWKAVSQSMQEQNATQHIYIVERNSQLPKQQQIKIQQSGKVEMTIQYDLPQKGIENKLMTLKFQITNNAESQMEMESEKQEVKSLEQKNQVIIKFQIDSNQFVTVKEIKQGDKKIKFQKQYFKQIAQKQMETMKMLQREMYVKDFEIMQSYEKKNELQTQIYKQKEYLASQQFLQYLKEEYVLMIKQFFQKLDEDLSENDQKYGLKDYETKLNEIRNILKQANRLVDQRKVEIQGYFNQLNKLQKYCVDTLNHISSNYRNTRAVAKTSEQIKQIHNWISEIIEKSKTKPANQLPAVPKQQIDSQYTVINQLLEELRMAPKPKQQQNPQNLMGSTFGGSPFGGFGSPRQGYYQEPRRRTNTQQEYGSFGRTRAGLHPSNNFFGGFF